MYCTKTHVVATATMVRVKVKVRDRKRRQVSRGVCNIFTHMKAFVIFATLDFPNAWVSL
jgi:hypothetical protein